MKEDIEIVVTPFPPFPVLDEQSLSKEQIDVLISKYKI